MRDMPGDICECVGQMPLPDPRPGCFHCGRPTPLGKWRCVDCQRDHDEICVLHAANGVVSDELARLVMARREQSAEIHGD